MSEKLIGVAELADMLGFKGKSQTVYQLVHKRKIPCIKISKRALRFRPSDIEKWLQEKSQRAEDKPLNIAEHNPKSTKSKRSGNISKSFVDLIVDAAKKEVCK